MGELTPKQKLFIEEYMINGFNATQAAIKAGYSPNTATEQGARLLINVNVREEVKRRCADVTAEYPLLRQRIIDRLQRIAFSDLKDYLSYKTIKAVVGTDKESGEPIIDYKTVIDVKDSEEVDGAIISEVMETREGFRFKRSDPLKALELLGKYTGLESAELAELKKQIEEIKNLIGRNKNGIE